MVYSQKLSLVKPENFKELLDATQLCYRSRRSNLPPKCSHPGCSFLKERNRIMIKFLMATGCRASELCSLNIMHLDKKRPQGALKVLGSRAYRGFYLKDPMFFKELWDFINKHRVGKNRGKQYVFDGERGKHRNERLTARKLSQILLRLGKLAKIPGKLTALSFRRSFATYQHRCGTSLFIIGKALGT